MADTDSDAPNTPVQTPCETIYCEDESDKLTVSGMRLDEEVRYPRIGTIQHKNIPDEAPREVHFLRELFGERLPEQPALAIAIGSLEVCGADDGLRIWCSATNVQRHGFDSQIYSPGGTIINKLEINYLELLNSHYSHGFQNGETILSASGPMNPLTAEIGGEIYTRLVSFNAKYDKPPKVVVWLCGFDINYNHNTSVSISVGNVDCDRFVLNFHCWWKTQFRDVKVTWVAYPSDAPGILSGTATTLSRRTNNSSQHFNRDYISFTDSTVFTKPPRVIIGLTSLSYKKFLPLNLKLKTANISPYGFSWDADSWDESVMYSAGISWLAMD